MQNSPLTSIQPSGLYKNITESTLIKTGTGNVIGVVINSHGSGTLKLWDNTSAATTVMFNTITFSVPTVTGERFIPFFGAKFLTGLYATVGGTADLTIIYN
jgi:hypothetical protein